MKLLHRVSPWSRPRFSCLRLVAIVKLANWVPITAGPGIWAIAALTMVLALLGRCDPASGGRLPRRSRHDGFEASLEPGWRFAEPAACSVSARRSSR